MVPPMYTLDNVPSYSSLPSLDESTLDYNPLRRIAPTGTFTKTWKQMTLILVEQEQDNGDIPSYGRNGCLKGELHLNEAPNILAVTLKLTGCLELSALECGATSNTLVSESYALYKRGDSTTSSRCPGVLPISLRIPTTCTIDGQTKELPPSVQYVFEDFPVPSLLVKAEYSLNIEVTRSRHKWLEPLASPKVYTIPILYRPRSRPSAPLPKSMPLSEALKSCPEDWFHIEATSESRPGVGTLSPISCHFTAPSSQVIGLDDVIPVHIQLIGPKSSLNAMFSPNPPPTTSKARKNTATVTPPPSSPLRVHLLRQISVHLGQHKATRNKIIGEGCLREIHLPTQSDLPSDQQVMTWQGEVTSTQDVSPSIPSAGFTTGNLFIKDFLVFSLTSPLGTSSPFLDVQKAYPIKLVTDSWVDTHPGEQ